jgi:hypothetical protein
MSKPSYEEQAKCNLACLLHLVGMVEAGDIDGAKRYADYVRAMLRLIEMVGDKEAA